MKEVALCSTYCTPHHKPRPPALPHTRKHDENVAIVPLHGQMPMSRIFLTAPKSSYSGRCCCAPLNSPSGPALRQARLRHPVKGLRLSERRWLHRNDGQLNSREIQEYLKARCAPALRCYRCCLLEVRSALLQPRLTPGLRPRRFRNTHTTNE